MKGANQPFADLRVLITHFRVGKTDGVSLEIAAWRKILQNGGARVALCAGPINVGADYVIDELEQQHNSIIYDIDENCFGQLTGFASQDELIAAFKAQQAPLANSLSQIIDDFKPTHLIFSNIFSVGEHLPAAGAFLQALDQYQPPTLLVHHDFHWDNPRCQKPSCEFVRQQLRQNFPPQRSYLTHVCISSLAQTELKKRTGVRAKLLHDTLDFDQPPWQIDDFNRDLLAQHQIASNNIIILQATRIVRRKNIELAIDLVAAMQKLTPQPLTLILAGYAEKRDEYYLQLLKDHANKKEVKLHLISNNIDARRKKGPPKTYSLWDTYPFADLITFPSKREGFGNQFLEAVFAQKVVATFEYPVFVADIKPKGFEIISLGSTCEFDPRTQLVRLPDQVLQNAAAEAFAVLGDQQRYKKMVEKNFQLGREYFSLDKTKEFFAKVLT